MEWGKTTSTKKVLEHIRSGLSDDELMQECGLSAEELKKFLERLVIAGFLKRSELDARASLFETIQVEMPAIEQTTEQASRIDGSVGASFLEKIKTIFGKTKSIISIMIIFFKPLITGLLDSLLEFRGRLKEVADQQNNLSTSDNHVAGVQPQSSSKLETLTNPLAIASAALMIAWLVSISVSGGWLWFMGWFLFLGCIALATGLAVAYKFKTANLTKHFAIIGVSALIVNIGFIIGKTHNNDRPVSVEAKEKIGSEARRIEEQKRLPEARKFAEERQNRVSQPKMEAQKLSNPTKMPDINTTSQGSGQSSGEPNNPRLWYLVYLLFGIWVFFDARKRLNNPFGWGIGTAILGPIVVPVYFAKRNLKEGEFREGGTGWNILRNFALSWTIVMLLFIAVAAIGAGRHASSLHGDAEMAGAVIGWGIGFVLLVALWFFPMLVAIVIGFFLKKSSLVEKGPTGQLANRCRS